MVIVFAHRWRVRWVVAALSLVACGATPAMPDAGVEHDAGHEAYTITDPAPPDPPAAPSSSCPDGWRARDVGGVIACEPWAQDSAPRCADDELAIPGVGCERIDTCPADGWPVDLPADDVIYVQEGATDGDGTRARPYGTLQQGLDAARGTTKIVALAAGAYDSGSTVEMRNTELRGACATGTIVTNDETSVSSSALTVYHASAVISGVTFRGGGQVLWLAPNAHVEARDLRVEATLTTAIRLDNGAGFDGERVKMVGVTTDARRGYGTVNLRLHTSFTLQSSTIQGGSTAIGVYGIEGDPDSYDNEVSLTDTAIMDSTLGVVAWADTTLERVALERMSTGVELSAGTTSALRDVRIRAMSGQGQVGALVVLEATAAADRVWISDGTDSAGVRSDFEGASLVMSDVVLFDYEANAAFEAVEGGRLELSRFAVRRVRGVVAESQGVSLPIDGASRSVLVMSDGDIEDVAATAVQNGDVIRARGVARAELERVRARSVARAFALSAAGGSIAARDCDVERSMGLLSECADSETLRCPPGHPSHIELDRVRLRDMQSFGVAVEGGTGAVRDLEVDGLDDDDRGLGVALYAAGQLTAERVRVRASTLYAIASLASGSVLTASDVQVRGTVASTCEEADPCEPFGGDALVCATEGSMAIERFLLAGSTRAGLLMASDCRSIALAHGSIAENGIGVLTTFGPLPERTFTDVELADNGANHQSIDVVVTPLEILE
jgi:hypothetical protein